MTSPDLPAELKAALDGKLRGAAPLTSSSAKRMIQYAALS